MGKKQTETLEIIHRTRKKGANAGVRSVIIASMARPLGIQNVSKRTNNMGKGHRDTYSEDMPIQFIIQKMTKPE